MNNKIVSGEGSVPSPLTLTKTDVILSLRLHPANKQTRSHISHVILVSACHVLVQRSVKRQILQFLRAQAYF